MISTGNPLLVGASGKLGNIVVKQYTGQIVITTVPDMHRRKLSAKQKQANTRMRYAIMAAKRTIANATRKQRACELLQVPPNKVFRAVVKEFLLTNGHGPLFEESPQEKQDKKTLVILKTAILNDIPDAEIMLIGTRVSGKPDTQTDWDILVLTGNDYPKILKWELQEKLFEITIKEGARVNIILAQKVKWFTEPEYEVIRKRIEGTLVPVN